jgi:hypothetical protein
MRVDFASGPYPAACFCGEYRQYVRGSVTANGRRVEHLMADPAGGSRAMLPRPGPGAAADNFQEDGMTAARSPFGANTFYGHRGAPYGNGNEFDQYFPDRATGCDWRGHDEPGPNDVPPGTLIEVDADFRAQVIDVVNGNEPLDTREWSVHCRKAF